MASKTRCEIWAEAWNSVAGSDNCTKKDTPSIWANKMLEEFDKKFPEVKQDEQLVREKLHKKLL